MSTVDKVFADKLVAANGQLYPDDPFEPPATRIVKYVNAWGKEAYGITFEGQNPEKYMEPTEFINQPVVYWEKTL
jgi:hypothetical protein